MNFLGAFSFGALIKTFFPGLIWVLVAAVFDENICRLGGCIDGRLFEFAADMPTQAALIAIPTAIIFGVVSNIVIFMGINDWLVRNPFKAKNAQLWALYQHAGDKLRAKHRAKLNPISVPLGAEYENSVDPEVLLLSHVDLDKVVHVREQYWYYLEFCMNLLAAGTLLAIGVVWHEIANNGCTEAIMTFIAWCIFGPLLFFSARKNYARHIQKMTSLFVAALNVETP